LRTGVLLIFREVRGFLRKGRRGLDRLGWLLELLLWLLLLRLSVPGVRCRLRDELWLWWRLRSAPRRLSCMSTDTDRRREEFSALNVGADDWREHWLWGHLRVVRVRKRSRADG